MKAKYINPYTDFGFKKIFGEEASKPLLMDFLNSLLPPEHHIARLTFKNNEQLGRTELDRKAIYDIYCENERGEKFIVELQKAKQNYFKARTVYQASFSPSGSTTSTFPIREQAEKGEWNYSLKAVYCIGILDFTFDDYETEAERKEFLHTIKLKNQNGKTFYDKLTYVYLEMPNFTKTEKQLKTRLDQWLYFIKNLEDFQTIPTIFKDKVFKQAFEKAKLAKLPPPDLTKYENSLKTYRDLKGVIDTAYDEGKMEGILEGKKEGILEGKKEGILEGTMKGKMEGKIEIVKQAKFMGLSTQDISKLTGLSEADIAAL
jgi:predicted transposase/invertase (TIGR01784 family)